jgi:hypothetical protein
MESGNHPSHSKWIRAKPSAYATTPRRRTGVSLSQLLPGLVYEVPVSLGTWLLSQGTAEEDVTLTGGLVIPLDRLSGVFTGGVKVSSTKDHEDDRPSRRKQKRR